MKHLLPLIAILLITSCTSKKAELVEQIKMYKDSLIVAEMAISGYQYAAKHILLNKSLTDSDKEFLKQQNFDKINYNSLDSMRQVWWVKSLSPKSKIEALELELKKY